MRHNARLMHTAVFLGMGLLPLLNATIAVNGNDTQSDSAARARFARFEQDALADIFKKLREGSLGDAIGATFYWQQGEGGTLPVLDHYRIVQILAELTTREYDLEVAIPEGTDWDARPVLQEIRDQLQGDGKVLLYHSEPTADMRRATLQCYAVADVTLLAELPPLAGIGLSGKPFAHVNPVKVYSLGKIAPYPRYAYRYPSASGTLLLNDRDIRDSCILINPNEIESNLRRYGLMNDENAREQLKSVMYNELAHLYSLTEMKEVFAPANFRKTVQVLIKGRPTPVTIHQINELYSDLVTLQHSRPHPAIYFSARMINTRAEPYRLIHLVTSSAFSRTLYDLQGSEPDAYKKLFDIGLEFKRVERSTGRREDADDAILKFAQLIENSPKVSERLLTCVREETEKLFQGCWDALSIQMGLDDSAASEAE